MDQVEEFFETGETVLRARHSGNGIVSKKLAALMLFAVLATAVPSYVVAQTYDVVINNGRVIDPETMLDGALNMGVRDGNVTAITREVIQGRQAIDAAGHVVAPGFIDPHSHNVPTAFGQKTGVARWRNNSSGTGARCASDLNHPGFA